jgi:hypothetical protein
MPRAVIEDEAPDEPRVGIGLVLHLHDLDHVEVNGLPFATRVGRTLSDGENGVDDVGGERGGKTGVEFGGEGGMGYRDERGMVSIWLGDLERVEELRVTTTAPR